MIQIPQSGLHDSNEIVSIIGTELEPSAGLEYKRNKLQNKDKIRLIRNCKENKGLFI